MEQLVRIKEVYPDGTAQVLHVRESACSGDCHQCSGCGAVKQTMLLTAVNAIQAKPGELVLISSESAPVLAAAGILYLLPVGLFILGYLVGMLLWEQGALAGCIAFAVGLLAAILYDRAVGKKRIVYTIKGYPEKQSGVPDKRG